MSTIDLLRENLAETLRAVGPGRPTLCEGWNTEHLLAHLILRETRPDAAAGIAIPALARRTDRITDEYAAELAEPAAFDHGVEAFLEARTVVRHVEGLDTPMNLIEYVVHREDVLRASPEGREAARRLVPFRVDEDLLVWEALVRRAGTFSAPYPGGLMLMGLQERGGNEVPVFGPHLARRPTHESVVSRMVQKVVKAQDDGAMTTLTGRPVDLVLYLFGRREAAEVESNQAVYPDC